MQGITSCFLDALKGTNSGRPPIWLMRQSGRYLPNYQKLRAKYSLKEIFFTPELAAQATLFPFAYFPFDAAILFSDISVIAPVLGLSLEFQEGPKVFPFVTPQNVSLLKCDLHQLEPMIQTIRYLLPQLPVPLIGFCGGPFTVATYLVQDAVKWMRDDPVSFEQFLNQIADVSIHYLQAQEKAGVSALQIFDSWASLLTDEEFNRFAFPYYQRMIQAVQIPTILFMRDSSKRLPLLQTLPCGLSLDERCILSDVRKTTPQLLQGNLSPHLLFESPSLIREKTKELIDLMKKDRSFIVNLSHGVLPKTPLEGVSCLIETILAASS